MFFMALQFCGLLKNFFVDYFLLILVTAVGDRPKSGLCFLPGRLR